MRLNLRKGKLLRKNWKLRYWCHVIALLLPIRMVFRLWPYHVPLQSYERLNFTVPKGRAINHFWEKLHINITSSLGQYCVILVQSLNCLSG